MLKKTLLVGEPMGLFIAQNKGSLDEADGYSVAIAGAEFNVAVGMTRLEHKVSYLTKLGSDPFGRRIVNTMNKNSIATDLISYSGERPTGFMLKSRVDEGDPEIFYFRKGSAASTLCAKDIESLDFSEYDMLHMTGIIPALSPSTREATFALLRKTKEQKIFISFDPNLRPQLWEDTETMRECVNRIAGECDLLLPGVNEAKILIGESDPAKIAEIYQQMGAKTVIVKLGQDGAYFSAGSENGFVEGFKAAKVVDTVGAGDGFAAGVLSALKEGLSVAEATRRGNAVGAIQVMSRGDNDGLPTRDELEDFMNGKENWRLNHNV